MELRDRPDDDPPLTEREQMEEMRAWIIETMGNLRSATAELRSVLERAEDRLRDLDFTQRD